MKARHSADRTWPAEVRARKSADILAQAREADRVWKKPERRAMQIKSRIDSAFTPIYGSRVRGVTALIISGRFNRSEDGRSRLIEKERVVGLGAILAFPGNKRNPLRMQGVFKARISLAV
jgi:hypothetical protein